MSVKMPKLVSKTELSRLYTRLAIDTHHRLDNSTAEGQARLDLLHRFFDASANLYGTMTLWHAWELFQHVEPELTAKKKILRKDFFSFAEIVRVEKHAYAIMLLPDLYEEETSISIQDAELVHRMLIYPNIWGLNEYYKLLSYQDDKPCVVPAHDVFYAYADPNYFWETPEARSLRFFLANLHVAPNTKPLRPTARLCAARRCQRLYSGQEMTTGSMTIIRRRGAKKQFPKKQTSHTCSASWKKSSAGFCCRLSAINFLTMWSCLKKPAFSLPSRSLKHSRTASVN